jgi:FKBP-type peptidyl-prolyl cis-trans isomerase (trigger factor)
MPKTKSQKKTKTDSAKPAPSAAKLTWLPKKTFELEFSVPWQAVKTASDKILTELTKEAELQGFRKGKAPRKIVEKSVDQAKLYGQIINQLLPISFAKAVKQHQLKPAVAPKIQIISAEENKTWRFKATSCELPKVELGDYQKIVKGSLAKEKIWTPDKGSPGKKEEKKLTDTQKFNLVAQTLLKTIKLELPDLLIETERDRLLAKLLDQVQKLGLTIEQYATSNQKTVDQLKQEYQKSAENTLKLELILQAIADNRKIKADDKEIDKMIASAGDEKIKKQLNTPAERAYIASVFKKRQAIDYLLSLQ